MVYSFLIKKNYAMNYKLLLILFLQLLLFQTIAQTPLDAPLPEKFKDLKEGLFVNNFPMKIYATTDENHKSMYQWKHTTSVLSLQEEMTIVEFGAYLFYNKKWNLRTTMYSKDFNKLFDTKKGILKKGQPYTWKDNWRTDNRLFGGRAMWYFITENADGERFYGIGRLETVGTLYSKGQLNNRTIE